MVCQAAIVVELATSRPAARALVRNPAPWTHRVCLPRRYANALTRGHFIVMVDGQPVALSLKPIKR